MRPHPLLLATSLTTLVTIGLSCQALGDESNADEASETTSGNTVTNGCGTFDISGPGDSQIPQDPDDPEIITACTSLCTAVAEVEGCASDIEGCVETCKFRSCGICPGTLAPLVDCETEQIDPSICSCANGSLECPDTDACDEVNAKTYQCGG